ncbi:hypothetical protein BBF96_04975 [Anoxybacter fermentans]|uniref:LysM domain-containing protein n=1 Tax=Anoxybacter fermentans TaxID=1323375 RepID=A0A3Q9HPJ3_9FIRM|nr:LysM peptidoglycan-binding domain-containing protein [Anoxybacter fermentans]AZR72801.1 hypothetical protein BBF96_04975 [Anoxybacter fermentans]
MKDYKKRVNIKRKSHKWRRFLFVVFGIIMIAIIIIGTRSVNSNGQLKLIEVTVSEGDTLWAIARSHYHSEGDIRKFIFRIRQINNLKTAQIYPGQVLLIPIVD